MQESTSQSKSKPSSRRNRERPAGQAASKQAAQKDPNAARAGQAAAEWLPIDSLRGWERNPRRHGETVPKLMRAIIRYGWGSPVEARSENREIIAGHGRMQAAQRLSAKWGKTSEARRSRWHPEARLVAETCQVPVRLRDLDEDDAHQAAIADNRIGQESSWDDGLLGEALEDFEDDIESMGFDEKEFSRLIGEEDFSDEKTLLHPPGETFAIVIECETERQQVELLDEGKRRGWKCRALV